MASDWLRWCKVLWVSRLLVMTRISPMLGWCLGKIMCGSSLGSMANRYFSRGNTFPPLAQVYTFRRFPGTCERGRQQYGLQVLLVGTRFQAARAGVHYSAFSAHLSEGEHGRYGLQVLLVGVHSTPPGQVCTFPVFSRHLSGGKGYLAGGEEGQPVWEGG